MSFTTMMIEMKYHNSIECAEILEDCAQAINGVSNSEIDDIVNYIQTSWKGDSASLCLNKVYRLKSEVYQDSHRIQYTANVIRRIANNVRNAEMRAYYIAHRRGY